MTTPIRTLTTSLHELRFNDAMEMIQWFTGLTAELRFLFLLPFVVAATALIAACWPHRARGHGLTLN